MPTPSARSAARAIAVLDHFTTHPGRPFTLSELSAVLGLSPSSLTSVLQALSDAGYLIRHPRHKTYELGPALVAVGHAARARHPVVDLARPELAALAEGFDADCLGSVLSADEILVLVVEGRASRRTRGVTVGQRVPLVPPFGEVWLAYGEPDMITRWLNRGLRGEQEREDLSETEQRMQEALRQVRARGYAVNLYTEQLDAVHKAVVRTHPERDEVSARLRDIAATFGKYELLDANPESTYDPEMIIAPVFGPDGSVTFAITLTGLRPCTGSEIERMAAEVVETGLRLTRAINGRVPSLNSRDQTAS
jgi:DNA-binding IclR family transcriptional regulator